VTLRGRLTTAFLAVVLGPVLLGSFFVGMTVATVSRDRTVERLDHAATTVRTAIGAVCRQLQAVADAVAVVPADARQATADQLTSRGLTTGVKITTAPESTAPDDAAPDSTAPDSTAPDNTAPDSTAPDNTAPGNSAPGKAAAGNGTEDRDCASPADTGVTAIAARARAGDVTVTAAQALDAGFVDRLAASSGAEVTLLTDDGRDAGAAQSTVAVRDRGRVAAAAGTAAPRTERGDRLVRRLATEPGQPLPLAVSVATSEPVGLYLLLLCAVVLVALGAVLVARWLARSTTRPLADLAVAVDRVAEGDLNTRVPVLRNDELGRLTGTFNRMTRELQAYVQALTASRDQLRGHLAILGDTLSSTHDLHRILQVILQTSLSATGARAGVVLIVDPADKTLVARCGEGLSGSWDVPEEELPARRIPLGAGILGAVAATGEPRRGLWGLTGPALDEPPCRTYVAVPICAPATVGDPLVPGEVPVATPPATLGVLALYDRLGSDEFDDADLLTLRTFAGQAGVAVHNVRMHEEAQRLSLTDPLTGLWNYRYLRESVRREVERASRFGRMLTVLVLDLDHFKEVNDTYGHAAGDTVLIEFARRLRVGLREVDVAFRQGGEEFVVLLPETDAYGGTIVAERLGAAIRDVPVTIESRGHAVDRIPIAVSIGIAVYPEHGSTAQQVLNAADDALYSAKNAGRDTFRLAEPVDVTRSAVSQAGTDGHFDAAAAAPGGPQPPRQSRGR
jgi:two-component system cell cycle response regulator